MNTLTALAILIGQICSGDLTCSKAMDRCVDVKVWEQLEYGVTEYTDDRPFLYLAECVQERNNMGVNSFHIKYKE